MNRVITQVYVNGSCGNMNLFSRDAGTVVECKDGRSYTQEKDAIILQWEGYPEFDSGYHQKGFDSINSALIYITTHY